jgi:hypothetical protein
MGRVADVVLGNRYWGLAVVRPRPIPVGKDHYGRTQMKKYTAVLAVAAAALAPGASAHGGSHVAHASRKAPNERCVQLDIAEHRLHRLGFRTRERGGGLFGIIVKADWVVVHQSQSGNVVTLTAGRSC